MHQSKKISCMFFIKDMNINKLTCFVVFFLANDIIGTEGVIGVNWGRQNAQRLVPSMVVDLLLQNNVSNARVYTSHTDILRAFSGSGINLTIGVYNIASVSTPKGARQWVNERFPEFQDSNIKRVFLGTLHSFDDRTTAGIALDALKYTQEALDAIGRGNDIKVNLPMPYWLLKDRITKPSEADFKDNMKPDLLRFFKILRANNAPFCLELFPITIVESLRIQADTGFTFPDNKSTHIVKDVNGSVYTDIFMFTYDAVAWALEKAGFSDIKIVVTQIGWPTDGYSGANVSAAEHFYKSLLPIVASGRGSPKRPNSTIDIFVHALTDENQNPVQLPYSRHWGIYRSNGEPKYKIDLSGRGRDIYPARARGIMRMPKRWCVVDKTKLSGNERKMEEAHTKACLHADCTCTFMGGSCSQLSRTDNASYAFNMVFQSYFQDDRECFFDGLGMIVYRDPSTSSCVFPVEVVRGIQNNFGCGNRITGMLGFAGKFLIFLSTLWALFCN